jgi:hypothetical protein
MESMQLEEGVDMHFPRPKSKRSFMPSTYIQTLVLMQHQGHLHFDEVRHLLEDTALTDAHWTYNKIKGYMPMVATNYPYRFN